MKLTLTEQSRLNVAGREAPASRCPVAASGLSLVCRPLVTARSLCGTSQINVVKAAPSTRGVHNRVVVAAALPEPSTLTADNPFVGAADLKLLTPSGGSVPVGEVTSGKVVVALLRHLGCLFCWEQARNLLDVKEQLAAAGYKLAVVAIGSPEGGRNFCASLPFPAELLFVDPEYDLYKHLQCYEGTKAMFSSETWEALKTRTWDELYPVMKKYQWIHPSKPDNTLVMGGIWVIDDGKVLYNYRDPGLAAHAPMSEVLAAACISAPAAAALA